MGLLLRGLTAKPVQACARALLGHYVTIYMIHRPTTFDGAYEGLAPELLERAIIYARDHGFEFASIDEVVEDAINGLPAKKPTMCFTLDDGYQDQVDNLVPVLLHYQCKPTLFVLTDMIEGNNWPWDSQLAHALWVSTRDSLTINFDGVKKELDLRDSEAKKSARRQLIRFAKQLPASTLMYFKDQMLAQLEVAISNVPPATYQPACWSSLREAEKNGLRIGSHACTHRVFTALTHEEVRRELADSRLKLNQELTNPSQVFCYPSGTDKDFRTEHCDLVQQAGFQAAVTSIAGNTNQRLIRNQLYRINRHSFPASMDKFIRYSSWLEYIRSRF